MITNPDQYICANMPRVVLVLLSLSVVLPYGTGVLSTGTNVAARNVTAANGTACDQFDPHEQKMLAGTRCAFGVICLIVTAIVLCVFICDEKPFKNFRRRIVLFLTVSTVFYLIVFVMQVSVALKQTLDEDHKCLCKAIGFFIQYFAWQELVLVIFITVYFCKEFKARYASFGVDLSTTRIERILYLTLVVVFPIIPAGLALIDDGYGETRGWCWIKLYNSDCNKTFGIIRQLLLWYVWCLLLGSVCLVVNIITMCAVHKRTEGKLRKEVLLLLSYPILFVVVNFFELVCWIVTYAEADNQSTLAIWMIYAIFSPISAAAIPVIFAIVYCCFQRVD